MPTRIRCPRCQTALKVAAMQHDRKVRCTCGEVFLVRGGRDDDDFDDAPRSRGQRSRDRAETSGNKGLILGLAIGGGCVLAGLLALVVILALVPEPEPPPQHIEDIALQLHLEMQKNIVNQQIPNVPGNFPQAVAPADEKAVLAQQLENLASGNDFRRGMALQHFRFMNVNHPERDKIAAAIERAALEKPNGQAELEALCHWATKAQIPTLIQIAAQGKNMFGERHGNVLKTLADLHDERALPILIDSLGDGGFDVDAVSRSIASFGTKAEGPLLKTAFRKSSKGRLQVHNVLKRMNVPTEKLVPPCLAALADGDPDVVRGALDWLEQTAADEKSRRQVSQALNTAAARKEYRGLAVSAMQKWGTAENVPIILEQLKGGPGVAPASGPGVNQLLLLLGQLKDERAVPLLVERTGHFFEWQSARKALEEFGPAAKPGLIKAMFDPNRDIRRHVGELLKCLNAAPDEMAPQAIAAAESTDPAIKALAFDWLHKNMMDDKLVAQAVKDAAEAKSRDAALEWLGKAEPVAEQRPAVMKVVEPLIKDDYRNAIVPFLKWSTKDQMESLIVLVMAEKNDFRPQSIDALSAIDDPKAAFAVATRVLNFFDRKKAVEALQKMGPAAENPAMQLLTHRDFTIRIAACQILEEVGTTKAVPALLNLAKVDRLSSDAANRAIAKIKSRG